MPQEVGEGGHVAGGRHIVVAGQQKQAVDQARRSHQYHEHRGVSPSSNTGGCHQYHEHRGVSPSPVP